MTGLTSSSLCKIHFVYSQLPEYLKERAFAFDRNLHLVSTKPSVPCAEASWPVFNFWYYSLQTRQIKH